MSQVRAIRSEEEYDNALARIAKLFDELTGSEGQVDDLDDPKRVELELLTDLVDLYEVRHHPIGFPDPISAIVFRMDQANLTHRDLVPFMGSRAKVSEVLSGKRAITMSMARALHQHSEYQPTSFCKNQEPNSRTHCRVLSMIDFPSEPWSRRVGFLTPKT